MPLTGCRENHQSKQTVNLIRLFVSNDLVTRTLLVHHRVSFRKGGNTAFPIGFLLITHKIW
jgi:hypothetical protein